jgi:hypothetical protein
MCSPAGVKALTEIDQRVSAGTKGFDQQWSSATTRGRARRKTFPGKHTGFLRLALRGAREQRLEQRLRFENLAAQIPTVLSLSLTPISLSCWRCSAHPRHVYPIAFKQVTDLIPKSPLLTEKSRAEGNMLEGETV